MRRPPVLLCLFAGAAAFPAGANAGVIAPVDLAPRATDPIIALRSAAGADGTAVIAYQQGITTFAAVKQPGQRFAAPTNFGPGGAPDVAVAPNGRAVLAWIEQVGGSEFVNVAVREPGAAGFAEPVPVPAEDVNRVSVAATAGGRVYVGWVVPAGAQLATIAPDAAAPTTVASIDAPVTGLDVGTQAERGWLLVTAKAGGTSTAQTRRWSPTSGLGAPFSLEALVDVAADPMLPGSGVNFQTLEPVVVSGPRPSMVWDSRSTSGMFGFGNTTSTVKLVDDVEAPSPVVVNTDSGTPPFGSVTRTPVAATGGPDDRGALVIGRQPDLLMPGIGASLSSAARSASGWTAAASLPAFAPAGPGVTEYVNGTALAPAANGNSLLSLTYGATAADSRVLLLPLTATGAAASPAPTVVDATVAAGDAPAGPIANAGAGNGDTLTTWVAANGGLNVPQVILDDVTPPALEFHPRPAAGLPAPTSQAHADTLNQQVKTVGFGVTARDVWTPATVAWDFGDGATATGPSVQHTFAAAGSHTVKVTATDAAGNTATATESVSIPTITFTPDAAVRLSGVKLSPKSFRVLAKGKTPSKGKGATLSYTLSAGARIDIKVLQSAKGYKNGKKCQAAKPKGPKQPPVRCELVKTVGTVGTPTGKAGANTFVITGKLGSKKLKPGKYKLSVGLLGRTTGVQTLPFTIKK